MPLVGSVPPPPPATRSKTTAAKTPAKLSDVKPADTKRREARVKTLDGYSQILQAGFLMTGQLADAETVDMHAPPLLGAIADIGDHHEGFGEALDRSDAFGPYLALAVAAIPMALQFMANHGRIDATKTSVGGILPPDQLANRRQVKLMKAQAEMIRQQRIAHEEAARAQAELQAEIEAYNSMAMQDAHA